MKRFFTKKSAAIILLAGIAIGQAAPVGIALAQMPNPAGGIGGLETAGGTLLPPSLSLNSPTPASSITKLLGVPVSDTPTHAYLSAMIASEQKRHFDSIWDFVKILIGQALKKVLLDRLVDAITGWFQRGRQGKIVEDWGKFFEEAKQGAVGEIAQELGAGFLCQPFNLQVRLLLTPVKKFSQDITCTLNQITDNINGFLDDFSKGGWLVYNELNYPQNNFYGATLLAWDEAIERQKRAEQAARDEAIAGQGFLSFKKCDAQGQNCHIITPGSFAGEAVKKVAIDTPFDMIIGADDIAGYIQAISNAALNSYLKDGLDAILASRKKSAGESSGAGGALCQGLTGSDLRTCLNFENLSNNTFESERTATISQLNDAVSTRRQITSLYGATAEAQGNFIDSYKALAACQDGKGSSDAAETKSRQLNEEQTLLILQDKLAFAQQASEEVEAAINAAKISDAQDLPTFMLSIKDALDLADPVSVSIALSDAQTDNASVQSDIDEKSPQLTADLALCQGN